MASVEQSMRSNASAQKKNNQQKNKLLLRIINQIFKKNGMAQITNLS